MPKRIQLEIGNCEQQVLSESRDNLKALYQKNKGKKILFSATPICDYQVEHGWPEPPFVNINTHGSSETTKDNWLGYVPGDSYNIDLVQIVEDNGAIDLWGRVERSNGYYDIVLEFDEKYATQTTYMSHDHKQMDYLREVAKACEDPWLQIDWEKTGGSKARYEFYHNGRKIGDASKTKIEKLLSGYELSKVEMQLTYLRDEGEEPKHFTKIKLYKKILFSSSRPLPKEKANHKNNHVKEGESSAHKKLNWIERLFAKPESK